MKGWGVSDQPGQLLVKCDNDFSFDQYPQMSQHMYSVDEQLIQVETFWPNKFGSSLFLFSLFSAVVAAGVTYAKYGWRMDTGHARQYDISTICGEIFCEFVQRCCATTHYLKSDEEKSNDCGSTNQMLLASGCTVDTGHFTWVSEKRKSSYIWE